MANQSADKTIGTPYDAIIIGGGFAGLSVAALLSKQGKRVLLLERAGRLGGRASYFEQDGFVWQYGQHSHRLAQDGLAAQVFQRLGRPLDFIETRGHKAFLYFRGKLYPRPEGLGALLSTPLMPLRSRLNFIRFYLKLLRQNPEDWYDRTLLEMYRTWLSDPKAERFLSFLGFTVMVPDPGRVSAGEVVQFLKRAAKARVKQGEPRGGSKQVIATLESAIRSGGGEIRMSEAAEKIVIQDGKATGVQTRDGLYAGEHIVFAAPVFRLFDLVDEPLFDPGFVAYAKGIQSSSGLSIDFVFDEPVTDIRGGILGIEIPLWVKFQSNIDASIAPPGKHIHTWGMLFEPGAPITDALVHETAARIKTIMAEVLPGAAEKIVRQRSLVIPVVNANVLLPGQSYPHRPEIIRPEIKRLYLIGDTTRAEGCSGDIAFASALQLADHLGQEPTP